jgi:hypothetical protein
MAVDDANHVITDIRAYHAHGKDNQQLQDLTLRLRKRLWKQGLPWKNILVDTGYSSGENYAFLEDLNLTSYIPPHGTYIGGPEGFIYEEEREVFVCPKGNDIPFKKHFLDSRTKTKKKEYRASKKSCIGCPLRDACLGKTAQEKKINVTAFRAEYERNNKRVKSKHGQRMKKRRTSTVEPVFGTLIQFLGLREINTRGLSQANKVMHIAAIAYNLKKHLNYSQKRAIVVAKFKAPSQIAINRSQAMLTTVLACVKVDVVLNQWEVKG